MQFGGSFGAAERIRFVESARAEEIVFRLFHPKVAIRARADLALKAVVDDSLSNG